MSSFFIKIPVFYFLFYMSNGSEFNVKMKNINLFLIKRNKTTGILIIRGKLLFDKHLNGRKFYHLNPHIFQS